MGIYEVSDGKLHARHHWTDITSKKFPWFNSNSKLTFTIASHFSLKIEHTTFMHSFTHGIQGESMVRVKSSADNVNI